MGENFIMSASNNDSYVFISYAHANSDVVLPTVKAMQDSNINIWYDEGIVAGSEWPEFIAEKVVSCTKFVLFVSNAYLQSQNCKRELNFAISRKKEILSVFLEDVDLSPGMEMQLGTYQSIYRSRFGLDQFFHDSLCKEPFFDACRLSADKVGKTTGSGNSNNVAKNTTSYNPTPKSAPTPTPTPVQNPVNNPAKPAFSFKGASATINATSNNNAASGYGNTSLPLKNKQIACLLMIFLGIFGAHWFYLENKKKGIISIAVLLLIFIIYAPLVTFLSIGYTIMGIIGLLSSDEKFEKKYSCRVR